MKVLNAIEKRYSCRSYQERPIDEKVLETVLEAARIAPSARNLQDWRFVVVTEPDTKQRVAVAANNQMFIADAAAIIVGCSISGHVMRCGQAIGPIDVAIAMDHISLQAAELGLATCWIGSFYPDQVRRVLGIPQDVAIIELMALGYPADQQRPRNRESIDSIVCSNEWTFGDGPWQ